MLFFLEKILVHSFYILSYFFKNFIYNEKEGIFT